MVTWVNSIIDWLVENVAQPAWQLVQKPVTWGVTGLVGFFVFLRNLVDWMVAELDNFQGRLVAAEQMVGYYMDPLSSSVAWNALSIAGDWLPLYDILVALGTWSTVWMACCLYRFVKSWIPTVS